MLSNKTIGFVGGGNMAEAIIAGLLRANGTAPTNIWVSGPRPERGEEIRQRYGVGVTTDNSDVVRRSDVLVLAVKPQILPSVIGEIRDSLRRDALVISVAAGITTTTIENGFPPTTRVVRAMPNTPAIVGAAATAVSAGKRATNIDMDVADALFSCVGLVVRLPERQLDAVTGLSGSGPAYIFLILEALSDAGVKVGLSRNSALRLAAQTVLGSAKMLLDTNGHPGQLKDRVTSPGGTAIAGLHTLEQGGLRTTLINAVEAATQRARELGQSNE